MDESLVRIIEGICVRPQCYVCGDRTLAEILAFITGFSFGRCPRHDGDPLLDFGRFVNDRFDQPSNVARSWTVLQQYQHLSPEEGRAAFFTLFREFRLRDETKPRSEA